MTPHPLLPRAEQRELYDECTEHAGVATDVTCAVLLGFIRVKTILWQTQQLIVYIKYIYMRMKLFAHLTLTIKMCA